MKFTVEKTLFEKLPTAIFGIVAVKGIDNHIQIPELSSMLNSNIEICEKYFAEKKVKESFEVACYRDAMRQLGFNPNKYMCSIEALLTRIAKKKGFPSISPVVDLGNAISIKYYIPIGAHDIDSTDCGFEVRPAVSSDRFRPFGADNSPENYEIPDEGEIIYAAGNSVRTRRWTWRQAEDGKITENVTSVFYPLDGFSDINKDRVIAARDELAEKIHEYFGVKPVTGFVDINHPYFEFPEK